ncbi:MAG TPA: hypothetical protein VK937_12110 [Candidatus Limnocylindria bacterium]|jgi:hypothetical protein|nr:hypothetical protein [Candidatus Limnocylindria bacterium]
MKQNVTISLDRQTIRKAKIVAARRDTSISGVFSFGRCQENASAHQGGDD